MITMNNASKGAPKSVGGTLADLLAARNLNQTEAATKLSLTRPYLNGIINGKYPLSMDLKMKLKSLLNVEPDFWAGVQAAHELWKGSPEGRRQLLERGREELYNSLDLRGAHVLVAHEIEEAVEGGAIEIDGLNLKIDGHRERLLQTSLLLTFGSVATVRVIGSEVGTDHDLTKGFVLKRGQMVEFHTHEDLKLHGRVRAVVNGLTDPFATSFVQLFCHRLREPGSIGQMSFGLINLGPMDLPLRAGDPCLSVSFEYLAQESLAHA
jgi:addiction module HigA family antidote